MICIPAYSRNDVINHRLRFIDMTSEDCINLILSLYAFDGYTLETCVDLLVDKNKEAQGLLAGDFRLEVCPSTSYSCSTWGHKQFSQPSTSLAERPGYCPRHPISVSVIGSGILA